MTFVVERLADLKRRREHLQLDLARAMEALDRLGPIDTFAEIVAGLEEATGGLGP